MILTSMMVFIYDFSSTKLSNIDGHQINKTLFIDHSFSAIEIDLIAQAAEEWSEKTHNIINIKIATLPSQVELNPNKDILIIKVSSDYPDIIMIDNIYHINSTVGYYNSAGSIKFIELVPERINYSIYKQIILHEIGHAIGLGHNNGNSIMSPSVNNASTYITVSDLKSFCHIYKCDYKKLE